MYGVFLHRQYKVGPSWTGRLFKLAGVNASHCNLETCVFKPFSMRAAVALALLLGACLGQISTASAKEVTDVLGRKVEVSDHVQRVVLGEGRLISVCLLYTSPSPRDS